MKTYVPFSQLRNTFKYALILLLSVGNLIAQTNVNQESNLILDTNDLKPLNGFNSILFNDENSVNETLQSRLTHNSSYWANQYTTQRTVTGVDLNGAQLGTDYGLLAQAGGYLYPIATPDHTITTTSGNATSVLLTFSSNINGTPPGVPDADENLYFFEPDGVTAIGAFAINTAATGALYNRVYGSNDLRLSILNTGIFSITEVNGAPILTTNLQAFINNIYYIHFGAVGTETNGVRHMIVEVTDPDNTLSASTHFNIGPYGLAVVDDNNSVMANSATTITGNLLANDTKNNPADILSATEVNGYSASVGMPFASTYGTITVMSDGSYSYQVDTANIAVSGLSDGESLNDIISYQSTDNSGFFDFGYINITIDGVTELPVATDNTNSVTVNTNPIATGDVIFDDDGFGIDSGDRPLALFIWENQFGQGGTYTGLSDPIDGQIRTEPTTGVTVSFASSDVDNIGVPAQDQVVYLTATNGGHTGYLGYVIDGSVNPSAPSVLTMNFDEPIVNLSFTLSDVDWSQGDTWQDLFTVTGNIAGADVPVTPQVSGSIVMVGTDTFYGTGSVIPEDAHGNVVISFTEPIDQVVISYNYGPDATAADNETQIAAISDLIWQSTSVPRVSEVDGNTANVGASYPTQYGDITINGNGTYTYTLDETNPIVANLATGSTLTDTIPYTLIDSVDATGNTATANLTITINGSLAPPPCLLNLSFDSGNPDNQGTDPNLIATAWVNGSEGTPLGGFGGSTPTPPANFINGYAEVTAAQGEFGHKWGFDGSITNTIGTIVPDIVSFDYEVLGHNGEADLLFEFGTFLLNIPIPSTSGEPLNQSINFDNTTNGEIGSGTVTLDFVNNELSVTHSGHTTYTTTIGSAISIENGVNNFSFLATKTNGDGFDANFNSTGGIDAYYRIDNFGICAIPPPPCEFEYKLIQLPNGDFQVSVIPAYNYTGTDFASSAQVTLVAPTGQLTPINTVNDGASTLTFAQNSTQVSPTENPSKDYFSWSHSGGANISSWTAGTEVILFTFQNSASCFSGSIYLIDNDNDPFMYNGTFNVGLQISTLQAGVDAPTCRASNFEVICLGPDNDNDGVPDATDLDDDNDGILDIEEALGLADSDGDGINDLFDLDSDNDGIYDVIEANGTDANNDGLADDDDDNLDNTATSGIPTSAGAGATVPNTDGTDGGDPYDTDADDDGCSDAKEAYADSNADGGDGEQYGTGIPAPTNPNGTVIAALYNTGVVSAVTDSGDYSVCDADGDGVQDNIDVCPGYDDNLDFDNDGVPDGCDQDIDNDGVTNIDENYGNDPEGDSDGDGIVNWQDGNNGNSGERVSGLYDMDNDGIPNHHDLDSDNDGIYDIVEAGGIDLNNDGLADDDDDNTDNTASNGFPTSAGTGIIPIQTSTTLGLLDMHNLDSDEDGCPDSNEAYNSSSAVNSSSGQYGNDPVDVDLLGKVISAAYNTGSTQIPSVVIFNTDLDYDGLSGVCDTDGDNPPVNNNDDITLGLDDNEKLAFKLYPNPAETKVTIVAAFDIDKAEIFNALGAKVLVTKGKIIDVSYLSAGVYTLKIQANNTFETKPLVIK